MKNKFNKNNFQQKDKMIVIVKFNYKKGLTMQHHFLCSCHLPLSNVYGSAIFIKYFSSFLFNYL